MSFEDRLLDSLKTEAATATPHRPRTALAIPGLAVLAVLAIAISAVLASPQAAIAVEEHGEWIHVRLLDVSADPEQVERELRDAGIDAHVVLDAAPPELVGKWTRVAFSYPGPVGVADPDEIRIPADSRYVEVGLGREPRPGEAVMQPAPGCPEQGSSTAEPSAPAPPPGDLTLPPGAVECRMTDT